MKVLRVVCIALLTQVAWAQERPPIPASMEGVVIQADSGRPIVGATVELRTEIGTSIGVTTDGDGIFVIRDVQPGAYRLLATQLGYVRGEYVPSRNTTGVQGIQVGAGAQLKELRILMTPSGVISGRVTDRGKPVVNQVVSAMKVSYDAEGREGWLKYLSANTDDQGEYRIFGLAPGHYRIRVALFDTIQRAPDVIFINPTNGAENPIISRGGNQAEMSRALPPGYLFARNSLVATVSDSEMHLGTYYPGTIDWRNSKLVDVGPGSETLHADIDASPVPALHIRGTATGIVADAQGQPIRPQITLFQKGSPSTAAFASVQVDANGAFEFSRIPSGFYLLRGAAVGLMGRTQVEVLDRDLNGVSLPLVPLASIAGRITVENGRDSAPVAGMAVQLLMDGPDLLTRNAISDDAGAFAISDVPIGDYRVRVAPLQGDPQGAPARLLTQISQTFKTFSESFPNASVKSIVSGTADILNDGFRVTLPTRQPLNITIGNDAGSLEGRVLKGQQPAVASTVVLIPEGSQQFHVAHKHVLSDEAGHYQFSNVAPGDYKLFVWESVEPNAWQNVDFIRLYESRGKVVHIDAGRKSMVDMPSLP